MQHDRPAPDYVSLPRTPIARLTRPLAHFLHTASASGVVLLLCTAVALAVANSPWAEEYAAILKLELGITIGEFAFHESLLHWINDGLMTIFFFVVGLEIKREVVEGELQEPRKAALPIMGALGGMLAPAGIYLALQLGQPGERGWGIPMATDIAFVVGFLALFGERVPFGLKIFLLSLAIADDIGAVLVIALFYSGAISATALGLAAAGIAVIVLARGLGIRSIPVYTLLGAAVWLAVFESGVHPTVAGVVLGLITPARPWIEPAALTDALRVARARLEVEGIDPNEHVLLTRTLARLTIESVPPLERLIRMLHPWVAFGIMPLFALANAGVTVEGSAFFDPVGLSVAAGLLFGKPLGIFLLSWLAVQIGIARLPGGVTWPVMLAGGCLAGIGFTMSLFIAALALPAELLDAGKIGTLTGSAISAVLGSALLVLFLPKKSPTGE